jgi:hypothetical protein
MADCARCASLRNAGTGTPSDPLISRISDGDDAMPAQSKAQQKAAGAALSAKRGETKVSDLKGASKSMYGSMSESELEELASTDRKDLPEKKSDD